MCLAKNIKKYFYIKVAFTEDKTIITVELYNNVIIIT